jgi:hypothetical protein
MSEVEDTFAFQLTAIGLPYEREYVAIPGRKFRWDYYIKPNLLIELQGGIWQMGGHSTGVGITRDCEKMNLAVLHGFRCLNFTTAMVMSGEALRFVEGVMGVI